MSGLLFILLFPAFLFGEPGTQQPFLVSPTLWDRAESVSHAADRPYGSYLVRNINFEAAQALFRQLDRRLGGTLDKKKARTEAHITVISPVEYDQVLKPLLSIKEINAIAAERRIQDVAFETVCMGRAASADGQKETYFLVVKSPALRALRQEVFRRYRLLGGDPSRFDPDLWYPHITIGYTHGDLHLERDGVMKGRNACWRPIDVLARPR